MKLSTQTLLTLRNFAGINANLAVKAGSEIRTITEALTIAATATVPDAFPVDFGIYDLDRFLSVIDMIPDAELNFGKTAVTISSGNPKSRLSKAVYRYADPTSLKTPKAEVKMPGITLSVTMPADCLNQIRKAAAVLGHAIVSIDGEGGEIVLTAMDPKNPSADTYSTVLDESNEYTGKFSCQFLISNIKKLADGRDYVVAISSKNLSRWTATNLEYFVAVEATSKFA